MKTYMNEYRVKLYGKLATATARSSTKQVRCVQVISLRDGSERWVLEFPGCLIKKEMWCVFPFHLVSLTLPWDCANVSQEIMQVAIDGPNTKKRLIDPRRSYKRGLYKKLVCGMKNVHLGACEKVSISQKLFPAQKESINNE